MAEKRNRREFLKLLGLGAAGITVPAVFSSRCSKSQKRPNILFLFTDDQRFNTINALNNPDIKTPNMDRLAQQGFSFSRAHIMGGTSGAVCMPSRAMLLTGKTLFHLDNRGANIPDDHIMLPEILQKAGYITFGTGKWHNGRKAYARCFTQGGKIMFGGMSDHLQVPVHDFDPSGEYPEVTKYMGTKFSSELFSDEAIHFLNEYKSEEPFFLCISYTAPHDPRMAPAEFSNLYPPEKIKIPKNFLPEHPFDHGEMFIRDEMLAPYPRTPEIIREHIAAYYAMITHLDFHIGRVLEALDRSGHADNTIIIFSSDNGLAVGQHGLLGKQNLYEHSVRVPLILYGPGIPQGKKTDALCYLLDIYPTLCQQLNLPVPETVEGKSLLPVIQDPAQSIRESLFLAYTHIHRAVRTENDWKLIKWNIKGTETTQLFHLGQDPWEIKNLADDPAYSQQLLELTKLMKDHMRHLNDFCDLDKPNWGLPEEKHTTTEVRHLAMGKKIQLLNDAVPKYNTRGAHVLIDGIRASSQFDDGYWLGLEGEDLDAVIELGTAFAINRVAVGFLENQASWIFLPAEFSVSLSKDGIEYFMSESILINEPAKNQFRQIKDFSLDFPGKKAQFIRIQAKNLGFCPHWHLGTGKPAWLFADEIVVT